MHAGPSLSRMTLALILLFLNTGIKSQVLSLCSVPAPGRSHLTWVLPQPRSPKHTLFKYCDEADLKYNSNALNLIDWTSQHSETFPML